MKKELCCPRHRDIEDSAHNTGRWYGWIEKGIQVSAKLHWGQLDISFELLINPNSEAVKVTRTLLWNPSLGVLRSQEGRMGDRRQGQECP